MVTSAIFNLSWVCVSSLKWALSYFMSFNCSLVGRNGNEQGHRPIYLETYALWLAGIMNSPFWFDSRR
ncbi:hypothetical protein EYC84_005775 [Monilinia fructicola]|uniref:Uncharacterized protein n=1 Tax=Monilinia fructicola TaxID=38448 RepID=A0A5M9K051_MONFR|nr:hypothetical protein EYC84_005775 [Monilinia fructicola]